MIDGRRIPALAISDAGADLPPILLLGPTAAKLAEAALNAAVARGAGKGVSDQPGLPGTRRSTHVVALDSPAAPDALCKMETTARDTWWVLHAPAWSALSRRVAAHCLVAWCPADDQLPHDDGGVNDDEEIDSGRAWEAPRGWKQWVFDSVSSGRSYTGIARGMARHLVARGYPHHRAYSAAADADASIQRLRKTTAVLAALRIGDLLHHGDACASAARSSA
jgi:hypothetical protein